MTCLPSQRCRRPNVLATDFSVRAGPEMAYHDGIDEAVRSGTVGGALRERRWVRRWVRPCSAGRFEATRRHDVDVALGGDAASTNRIEQRKAARALESLEHERG